MLQKQKMMTKYIKKKNTVWSQFYNLKKTEKKEKKRKKENKQKRREEKRRKVHVVTRLGKTIQNEIF